MSEHAVVQDPDLGTSRWPGPDAASPTSSGAQRRLDSLLRHSFPGAAARFGDDAIADPFRGLYITPDQVARSLDGSAGDPLRGSEPEPDWQVIVAENPAWDWLQRAYTLSNPELDLVLIALAPEIDLRYERVFGFLSDDMTRRRPTVDLALSLISVTSEARQLSRNLLGAGAQLIRNHVLQLIPEPNQVAPPLLSHFLVVDDQIVDALLAQGGIDRRLVSACRLVSATPRADETDHDARARELLSVREADGSRPVRLYFQGPRDAGQIECAERLATEAGSPLLIVDVTTLAHSSAPMVDMLPLVFREAVLHGAVIYLDGSDIVVGEHDQTRTALDAEIARHPGITILAGRNDWVSAGPEPLGVVTVNFTIPDPDERQQLWEQALDEVGAHLPRDDITLLASRFNLTRTSIREAALTAHHATRIPASAEWSQEARSQQAPTLPALFAAARSQTGHDLAALARKIDPMYGWDDIVLSTDATAQLHELCDRVIFSERVMRTWGFKRKMSQGTGISALFAGPSGTGKTMAAEVIARAVGLDLFKVDLSSVISKYIGETEKNLEKIFTAAADANAILLFDEAEALFGKRSEIRDSHDRYANIEIAYLLQRMEQFDGVSILTTNLRQHLDDAFTRRLQYVIEFPFPDEAHRRRIWQVSLPADTPYDPAIDFDALAREFRLPGGNIVNVVLAAAYLAAAQDSTIGMPHLLRAIRREYQKMGRVIPTSELDTAGEPS